MVKQILLGETITVQLTRQIIDDRICQAAVTKLTPQQAEENWQQIDSTFVSQKLIKKFVTDYLQSSTNKVAGSFVICNDVKWAQKYGFLLTFKYFCIISIYLSAECNGASVCRLCLSAVIMTLTIALSSDEKWLFELPSLLKLLVKY